MTHETWLGRCNPTMSDSEFHLDFVSLSTCCILSSHIRIADPAAIITTKIHQCSVLDIRQSYDNGSKAHTTAMPPSSKRRLKDANAHRPNKTARHAKDLNRQRAADATSTAETAETLKTPELNSADASRLTGPQSELKALSPVSSNAQSAVIAWSKTVAAAGVIFHDVSCLSRPQPPAKVKATTPSSTFWNPERRALRASLETALTYAFRSDLALPMTTTQYCAREDALKLARLASLNPARQDIQAQAEAMIKYVAGFPADASRLSRNDLQTVVNQMCDDVNFRRVNPHLTNGDILRIRTLRWPYEVPCIAVLAPNGVDKDVKYPLSKPAILVESLVANMFRLQSSIGEAITTSFISPSIASTTILTLDSLVLR